VINLLKLLDPFFPDLCSLFSVLFSLLSAEIDSQVKRRYDTFVFRLAGRSRFRAKARDRGKSALHTARRRGNPGTGRPAGLGPQKQTAFAMCRGDGEKVM
jgi:hypothetical protein